MPKQVLDARGEPTPGGPAESARPARGGRPTRSGSPGAGVRPQIGVRPDLRYVPEVGVRPQVGVRPDLRYRPELGLRLEVGGRPRSLAVAFAFALAFALASPAAAQRPPELKGSPDKLAEQNRLADDYDLSRMDGPAEIRRLVRSGSLVAVPRRGRGYYIDRKLGRGYASREVLSYARPWVREFLRRIGAQYADRFHGARFKISSLVRTERYQELLKGRNVNAARGDDEDTRSPHLTGAAVDISKKGMTARQLAWMRDRLVTLQERGWILGTEEMATNTFHVFVEPDFGDPPAKAATQAADRPPATAKKHAQ